MFCGSRMPSLKIDRTVTVSRHQSVVKRFVGTRPDHSTVQILDYTPQTCQLEDCVAAFPAIDPSSACLFTTSIARDK